MAGPTQGTTLDLRPVVTDPWSAAATVAGRARWRWAVLAVVVGGSGVLGRLWQLGVNARRAALVLVVAAVVWELLLRSWARRPARPLVAVGLLGVAVAAEVASAPSGGRAPAVLLLVSVTVADAALVDWRPTAAWPRRQVPVAGLAVPFLVVAQVLWYRTGAAPVFLALLAVSLVVVEAYHRRPAAVRPADRALARALTWLGDLLGTVAVLVVALPLYLAGQVGRLLRLGPASNRARRGASGWQPTSAAPVRDAAVPFSSPPPQVRRRRHVGAVLTVVLVGAAVAAVSVWSRTSSPVPPVPTTSGTAPAVLPATTAPPTAMDLLASVPYSERGAYAGDAWADELQRDQSQVDLVPDAATGWRNAATTSTPLVNVRDGRRQTPATTCAGCPQATVWLVGASSAFGIGQRDQGTVAAGLVRAAARDGIALDVVNLGVPGWTAHQEVTDALDRLQRSSDRPDAVVVLDGFNDVTAATAREVLGRGGDTSPLVFEQDSVQRALDAAPLTRAQVDRVVGRSVSALRSEHDRLAVALRAAGVPLFQFFQPDAFASRRQLAAVRRLYKVLPGLVERPELGDALRRTAVALGPATTDLRAAFDDQQRPVMVDVVHTNETGAAVVADRLYEQLAPSLRG